MSEPVVIDFQTFPVAERDQALGAYMDSWNAVERTLFMMVVTLTRADFGVARAIYANASGVAALRELLLALGGLWLTDDERRGLERVLNKLKSYSTKRNRIVHGEWVPHLDNPRAPTRFDRWVRHYHSPDHETFMGALTGDDQKAAANFSFTVRKISELACANRALAERMATFMEPIQSRLPMLELPKEPA